MVASNPHFEEAEGKRVLYVDGRPFVILSCEIPWWEIEPGRVRETMHAYDALYPAAKELGMNTMKVPIKWSCVETEKGRYDFSYPDHVIDMCRKHGMKAVLGWFGHYASIDGNIYDNLKGNMYAPLYIIEDEETYPRAVDGHGRSHHNCACYEHPAIVEAETAAFTAFMRHLRDIDGSEGTVVMIQVENEVALFGMDRQNRAYWRDHHPLAEAAFQKCGHTDELLFSAQRVCTQWLRPLSDAGRAQYDLPMFANFVGGKLQDNIVGGSPGEDVRTYMDELPALDFCGLNMYVQAGRSTNDVWAALQEYRVGRNLPSITECNSDTSGMSARLAFMSIGMFGSPIFAPWALNVSHPQLFEPFINDDGSHGPAFKGLYEPYTALAPLLELLALYGGTPRARVFMPLEPGKRFSQIAQFAGHQVVVQGESGGQCILIDAPDGSLYACGYRCSVTVNTPKAVYPSIKDISLESGEYRGQWVRCADVNFTLLNEPAVFFTLRVPTAVRLRGF